MQRLRARSFFWRIQFNIKKVVFFRHFFFFDPNWVFFFSFSVWDMIRADNFTILVNITNPTLLGHLICIHVIKIRADINAMMFLGLVFQPLRLLWLWVLSSCDFAMLSCTFVVWLERIQPNLRQRKKINISSMIYYDQDLAYATLIKRHFKYFIYQKDQRQALTLLHLLPSSV